MKIILKRIKTTSYDELVDMFSTSLLDKKEEAINYLEQNAEIVYIDGKEIEIDIDINNYLSVIDECLNSSYTNKMERADIWIAKKLHTEFSSANIDIPFYLLYEKEIWVYLNIVVFFDVIIKRFSDLKLVKKEDQIKKIKRLFFCKDSKIDRTGLRWLWVLANVTFDIEYGYELLEIAREFIDPVKAIYECCLGRNEIVFKAFILAIKLQNKNIKIRSKYREEVPKHIRNLALMNVYESYDSLKLLANVINNDISDIIQIYEKISD